MKHIVAIIGAVLTSAALLLVPTAQAAGICDNHGFGPGQIYKAACAKGSGWWRLQRPRRRRRRGVR
ncbi:hypothetical protein SHEEN_71 [Mycobacterium phage Sheen]|uniref:Uncharacterized protein n=1 Tax=Mycobacterium phage Sheen TaxID=1589274 RepID=A0A0B5A3N5_9CAUD|nr:hypothetical protein AVV31_gp23 [Mycobacterium phage Sheen]AJD82489.1 hypothetical protein SHEEN_71 [Mycobacterium phage Sheen]